MTNRPRIEFCILMCDEIHLLLPSSKLLIAQNITSIRFITMIYQWLIDTYPYTDGFYVCICQSLLISFAILITHSVRQQWSIVTIAQEYLKHFQCCFWLVFWNPVTSNICECFKHTQDSNINIHQQSDHYHQRTMNPSNIKNRLLETLH